MMHFRQARGTNFIERRLVFSLASVAAGIALLCFAPELTQPVLLAQGAACDDEHQCPEGTVCCPETGSCIDPETECCCAGQSSSDPQQCCELCEGLTPPEASSLTPEALSALGLADDPDVKELLSQMGENAAKFSSDSPAEFLDGVISPELLSKVRSKISARESHVSK